MIVVLIKVQKVSISSVCYLKQNFQSWSKITETKFTHLQTARLNLSWKYFVWLAQWSLFCFVLVLFCNWIWMTFNRAHLVRFHRPNIFLLLCSSSWLYIYNRHETYRCFSLWCPLYKVNDDTRHPCFTPSLSKLDL